ncbi:STAS domain-containing protein [Amycolatopsis lurida]
MSEIVITTRVRDDVLIAYLCGNIDQISAPVMAAFVHERINAHEDFVLDLRGISFLGAAGLAVLLRMVTIAAEQRCHVGSGGPGTGGQSCDRHGRVEYRATHAPDPPPRAE